jgi:hypothetical protein
MSSTSKFYNSDDVSLGCHSLAHKLNDKSRLSRNLTDKSLQNKLKKIDRPLSPVSYRKAKEAPIISFKESRIIQSRKSPYMEHLSAREKEIMLFKKLNQLPDKITVPSLILEQELQKINPLKSPGNKIPGTNRIYEAKPVIPELTSPEKFKLERDKLRKKRENKNLNLFNKINNINNNNNSNNNCNNNYNNKEIVYNSCVSELSVDIDNGDGYYNEQEFDMYNDKNYLEDLSNNIQWWHNDDEVSRNLSGSDRGSSVGSEYGVLDDEVVHLNNDEEYISSIV